MAGLDPRGLIDRIYVGAHLTLLDTKYISTYSTFPNRLALANNVDPDQTPQNTASDQCIQCLPLTINNFAHIRRYTVNALVEEKYKVKSRGTNI